MTEDLVSRLSRIRDLDEKDALLDIERILSVSTGGSLTVKAARDTLTKTLASVRQGNMQLIGREPEDMVVMISVRDLAAVITHSAKPLSFGSALDEVGFEPLSKRIVIVPRKAAPPLRRS